MTSFEWLCVHVGSVELKQSDRYSSQEHFFINTTLPNDYTKKEKIR